jgi:CBS domain-containing protein
MSIGKICEREVIIAPTDMPVHEAAKLMKKHNIGDIIVVTDKDSKVKPVGILTDRDIAMKIVADELDAKKIGIGDAMSQDLLTLNYHQGVQEAIDMMSAKGVRRAPVVDDQYKIIGIASIDDLLILVADEISSLAKLVRKQLQ